MEPLPRGSYYDPGDYYDPSNYWLGMYEVEMRSESVQGTAPEAEGGRIHEGNPGFVGDINHESVNNEGDINLEDNINLEGDINLDGDINLESNINLEGDINLDGDINLESDINMDGGDINLDGDINLEGIDFEGIDFESDINFEGFNFEDDINFEGIDFEGINFEGINFESDINFEGINFESDINFEGDVNYEGNINREVVVNHEGEGNHEVGSGVQELGQQQPEELPQVAAAEAPQPRSRQRGVQRNKFTPMQVRELESVFQHTQYPDALTRRELARRMNVTEIRVQVWFKNKRAKCRRDERASMLRNAPPANLDHIFVFMLDGSNMPSRSEARLEMGSFGATDTLPRLPPL